MTKAQSVGLSAAAFAVVVLAATPLGNAAQTAALKGVPFAKKAGSTF